MLGSIMAWLVVLPSQLPVPTLENVFWVKEGERQVATFTASRAPEVLLSPAMSSPAQLVLAQGGGRRPLEHREVRTESARLLRVEGPFSAEGDATLELRVEERLLAQWPVRLVPDSQEPPEVAALERDPAGCAHLPPDAGCDVALALLDRCSKIARHRGDAGSAARHMEVAYEHALRCGRLTLAARRARAASQHHAGQGAVTLSAEWLARAKALDQELPSRREPAGTLYTQAVLHQRRGEPLEALRLASAALDLAESTLERERQASTGEFLASLLAGYGRGAEVLELLDHLPVVNPGRRRVVRAALTFQLMTLDRIPQDYPALAAELESSLSAPSLEGATRWEVMCDLAQLALLTGDLAAAGRWLWILPPSAQVLGWSHVRARLLTAELHLRAGRLRAVEQALGELEETTALHAGERAGVLDLRGQLALRTGQGEQARRRFREALLLLERVEDSLALPREGARFAWQHRRTRENLARLLLASDDTPGTLELMDRGERRRFGHLNALVSPAQAPEAWRAWQTDKELYAQAEAQGCVQHPPAQRPACEQELARRARAMERSKEHLVSAADRAPDGGAPWVAQVRASLAPGEGVLFLFRLGEGWLLGGVDAQGAWAEPFAGEPAARWRDRVAGLAHLSLVLGPGAAERWAQSAARLLSTQPSARIPHATFRPLPTTRSSTAVLLIGDPDHTLPQVRAQARALGELLRATPLLGQEASLTELRRRWPDAAVIHFLGHAERRHGDPWTSALTLSDGRLYMEDILSMRTSARLSFLEACSAEAPSLTGDLSLPEALLATGAEWVVASTRDLAAGESQDFSLDFYRALATEPPPRAMQRAIERAEARGDHSWRAFRLWGRPR